MRFSMVIVLGCAAGFAAVAREGAPAEQESAGRALDGARKALAFVQKSAPRPEQTVALAALERRFTEAGATPAADWKALEADAAKLQRRTIFSHPALDFDDILFVEREVFGRNFGDGQQAMDQYFGHNALRGGGLYILRNFKSNAPELVDVVKGLTVPSGTNQGLALSDGAFVSPDLSFDGRTIAFGWASANYAQDKPAESRKWKLENRFNIFRVNVDGTGLQRLSDGDYDDFDPCWLPNGTLAFISTRRGGYGRCHPRPVPTYTLFRMNADGSGIGCLSYHETNEWQPSVDHNGMILFTRWDYIDRDPMIAIHPWVCYPDGRNPRAVHGNYPVPFTTMSGSGWPDGKNLRPLCEHNLRAIPGSRKYVGVATPHHDQSFGSLILVDPSVVDDGQMSQVTRLTPETRFPEAERGPLAYGTPWPFSEDLYLCNYRDGICVLWFADGVPQRELVYTGRKLRPIDPLPVRARPAPPVIPDAAVIGGKATEERPSTVYIDNVKITDALGKLPEGAILKELRIVQVFPKTTPLVDKPRICFRDESIVRASLGTVPIEEDGSVYFEAPVGKEIYFQILDDRGLAVQSMRSGTFLHRGEQLSCVGCHEGPYQAPGSARRSQATQRPPSKIKPELAGMPGLEPVEPANFYRLAKPVLDAKCGSCHDGKAAKPVMSYDGLKEYLFAFDGGIHRLNAPKWGGSRTTPGQFGAHESRLYKEGYLTGTAEKCTGRAKLSEQELRRITLWLDLNSNELGAYHDIGAQQQGKLVLPKID